jgi:hypothetical protein
MSNNQNNTTSATARARATWEAAVAAHAAAVARAFDELRRSFDPRDEWEAENAAGVAYAATKEVARMFNGSRIALVECNPWDTEGDAEAAAMDAWESLS